MFCFENDILRFLTEAHFATRDLIQQLHSRSLEEDENTSAESRTHRLAKGHENDQTGRVHRHERLWNNEGDNFDCELPEQSCWYHEVPGNVCRKSRSFAALRGPLTPPPVVNCYKLLVRTQRSTSEWTRCQRKTRVDWWTHACHLPIFAKCLPTKMPQSTSVCHAHNNLIARTHSQLVNTCAFTHFYKMPTIPGTKDATCMHGMPTKSVHWMQRQVDVCWRHQIRLFFTSKEAQRRLCQQARGQKTKVK